MTPPRVRVESLDSARHSVTDFQCGRPALDRWLRAYAGQSERLDVARTFVAVEPAGAVVGYYTLVAAQVEHEDAPASVRARVSRHYPIPVGLIARLAVSESHQRLGLGTDLMRDATRRLVRASEQIGIRAILVHAIDMEAAAFYVRLGFEGAAADRLTLMVPIAAARRQLGADR